MPVIRELDPVTINHIAAGEVVERPASVFKELVDNALDAGASQISAYIKSGGISEITVKDNGGGMADEDAMNCLLSHYTSKIRQIGDLESITTMGFRGEALPSIASVSRLWLRTREPGAEYGYEIKAEGGKITESGTCACPEGTSVTVNDLFYNTPARYKFLKKDSLEAGYIADMMGKLALTRPDVSFRLVNEEGKTMLYTPGNNDLLSAIYAVFNRKTAEGMVLVTGIHEPLRISGYISTPENARGNRSRQVFIVNGRSISSRTLTAAVDEAIRGWFVKSRFPALVLQITVPPELIDINVHPQKSELRFWNDREVFRAIYHTVQNTLAAAAGIPSMLDQQETSDQSDQREDIPPTESATERTSLTDASPAEENKQRQVNTGKDKRFYQQGVNDIPFTYVADQTKTLTESEVSSLTENNKQAELTDQKREYFPGEGSPQATSGDEYKQMPIAQLKVSSLKDARIIGTYANTYILLETKGELVIIDQHAAHERILYEGLLSRTNDKTGRHKHSSQILLWPHKMKISELEASVLEEYREQILNLGFDFELFGTDTIVIRAVPELQAELNPEFAIAAIIEACMTENPRSEERRKEILHDIACKAAVKSNDKLDDIEIKKLLTDLEDLDNPYHCPHGRPVLIRFSRKDLDKMFRRIV